MKIIKTKKIYELLPLKFIVKEMYYKDLDEKLLKNGFKWGSHQHPKIPSNYILLTTDKKIIKTNSYEMFKHFSFFKEVDIELVLEMLE